MDGQAVMYERILRSAETPASEALQRAALRVGRRARTEGRTRLHSVLAQREDAAQDVLAELARSEYIRVKTKALTNPRCPEGVKEEAARQPHPEVGAALAETALTPLAAERLASWAVERNRRAAAEKEEKEALRSLLENETVPDETAWNLLKETRASGDRDVRHSRARCVGQHPRLRTRVLESGEAELCRHLVRGGELEGGEWDRAVLFGITVPQAEADAAHSGGGTPSLLNGSDVLHLLRAKRTPERVREHLLRLVRTHDLTGVPYERELRAHALPEGRGSELAQEASLTRDPRRLEEIAYDASLDAEGAWALVRNEGTPSRAAAHVTLRHLRHGAGARACRERLWDKEYLYSVCKVAPGYLSPTSEDPVLCVETTLRVLTELCDSPNNGWSDGPKQAAGLLHYVPAEAWEEIPWHVGRRLVGHDETYNAWFAQVLEDELVDEGAWEVFDTLAEESAGYDGSTRDFARGCARMVAELT